MLPASFGMSFCSTFFTRDGIKEMQGRCRIGLVILSCLAFSLAVVCKTWISDLERLILFLARRLGRAKVIH